jgi:hypothetical protein
MAGGRPAALTVEPWYADHAPPTPGVTVVTAGDKTFDEVAEDPVTLALMSSGHRLIPVIEPRPGANATNRLVTNRNAAAYTFGYNAPLVVERARRVIAALGAARKAAGTLPVTLVALDAQSTPWAALAAASAPELVDRAAFVTDGFRFATVTSMEDAAFLPGSVKYGDLPALLAMLAPKPLWIAGESAEQTSLVRDVYRAAGAPKALTVSRAQGSRVHEDLVKWIKAAN